MIKFKIGDRVRVIATDDTDCCDVGQIGKVLDLSDVPVIQFETPTRWNRQIELSDGSLAKAGYCDVLHQSQLEFVTDS